MWSVVQHAAAATVRASRSAALIKQLGNLQARVQLGQTRASAFGRQSWLVGCRTFVLTARRPSPTSSAKSTTTRKTKRTATGKAKAGKAKAKKTASRGRPKKALTEEEKAKKDIRELRQVALLKEPARLPERSWMVYAAQHLKHIKGAHELGPTMKSLASSYKELSHSELEHLKTTAAQNRLANEASYKSWVESHTPEEVSDANRARQRLKNHYKKSVRGPIRDDRLPKRSLSAYVLYAKSRWQSGDFAGRTPAEASVSLSHEWKSLTEAERHPFFESAKTDADRYQREVQSILNRKVRRRAGTAA